MATEEQQLHARALYHNGVLSLLEPVDLPEGVEVDVSIHVRPSQAERVVLPAPPGCVYPTVLIPARALDKLTDLVALGGDALADSEALYDSD